MIQLFFGKNSFEIDRALKNVTSTSKSIAERVDGETLTKNDFGDLTGGPTLFSSNRLIIIKDLSSNSSLWSDASDSLERVSDETQLILVDESPDKRGKTYKWLQKNADVKEFPAWSDRDHAKAEGWLDQEAKERGIGLTSKDVRILVQRVGTDQWRLSEALEKLSLLDEITPDEIERIIEAHPDHNVFSLFETALRGDRQSLHNLIEGLERTEDPFRVFGLLASQIQQFVALSLSDRSSAEVAKDIGAHPFVLSKLSSFAKRTTAGEAREMIALAAEADDGIKTSLGEPWLLIERMLQKIAAR